MANQRPVSGERTSMNWWASALMRSGARNEHFARAVLKEDDGKLARLRALSVSVGLPIGETFDFMLPTETTKLLSLISHLTKTEWKATFRLTRCGDGALVYRDLDITAETAASTIAKLPHEGQTVGRVSPYKPAIISGTVLASQGNLCLELVHGPHFWLTKGAPDGIALLRCCYDFPHLSIRYSTAETSERRLLFEHLTYVVRAALGLSIRQVPEAESALYAEYIWRGDCGYRFLDCSFSEAWTGMDTRSPL